MFFSLRFRIGALVVALAALSAARAQTVTFAVSGGGNFYFSNGSTQVPTGSLVLLIADTAQNGFGSLLNGSSLGAGSYLNADDQVLGVMTTDSGGLAMGQFDNVPLANNPTPGAYTALTPGDPVALVWFSTLTGSSTQLTTGDSYGVFTNSSSTADGDFWFVPSNGGTITVNFLTFLQGGGHAETDGKTALAVSAIPEPSTYAAIAGLSALGLAALRRSRRHGSSPV